MSSSSESHGTHDLNAPAMSQALDATEVRALKRIYDKLAEQGGGTWATYMLMEIKEWEELRKSALVQSMREALEQLVRCEYESAEPGMCDCVDNHGKPYQSQHLASSIAAAESALVKP